MKTSSRSKRIGLIALWLFLLLVGAPFWLAYRQMRREQLSYTLIAAIRRKDTIAALATLEAGADPKARDTPPKQISLWQRVQQLLASWRGQLPPISPEGPSAVFLAAEHEEVDVVHSLFVRGADKAGFVKAWHLSHEAPMLGETPGHDPPRCIPPIARLAGARIGYSTIEDLERWW
jgi:hypothetical protein